MEYSNDTGKNPPKLCILPKNSKKTSEKNRFSSHAWEKNKST
jgi:hypothetical protein